MWKYQMIDYELYLSDLISHFFVKVSMIALYELLYKLWIRT